MSYTTEVFAEVFDQCIYRSKNIVIDKCYSESDSYSTEIIKSYYYSCIIRGLAYKNSDKLYDVIDWCLHQPIELEDALQLTKLKNSL